MGERAMATSGHPSSMAPALITVHPDGSCVVVAVGAALRIFNLRTQSAVEVQDSTDPALHGDAIRSVAFDVKGSLFASVGDDKLVKLWNANTWTCLKTIRLAKKVSAVAFSHDSTWLMVADKFGIVYVFSTAPADTVDEPIQLLAHCCSIITGMGCSPDGKYIVTSDRDHKVRVTRFPERPLAGAHEIHTYCLGHNNACTGAREDVLVSAQKDILHDYYGSQGILISGGGDATLRMWEYETGTLLGSYDTAQAEVGCPSEDSRSVVALAASPIDSTVATIIERFEGVLLFTCDVAEKQLRLLQVVRLGHSPPSSLTFDCTGLLWLVAGAAETVEMGDEVVTPEALIAAQMQGQAIALAAVTQVQVVKNCVLLEESSVPGGNLLLCTLQGNHADISKVHAATEAAELAMKNLLTKRSYTVEQRENRKRMRNDKKMTYISSE